jgi:AcrR family transcriptional regulator
MREDHVETNVRAIIKAEVRKSRKTGEKKAASKGQQTRAAVVEEALRIASAEGLAAVTIGRLASELKMSKSGLFAHFRSKEALELETVALARTVFAAQVLIPAEATQPGLENLWNLCHFWLEHIEERVFRGAYFFAGAFFERARQGGAVGREIRRAVRECRDALQSAVKEAQKRKQLDREADAKQIAFDLNGLLLGVYWAHLMGQWGALGQARDKVLERLRVLATEEVPAKALRSVRAFRRYLKGKHA